MSAENLVTKFQQNLEHSTSENRMRMLFGKSAGITRRLVRNNQFKKHTPTSHYKTELNVEENDYTMGNVKIFDYKMAENPYENLRSSPE